MAKTDLEGGFEPREMFAQPKVFGAVHAAPPPATGVEKEDWRYRSAVAQHMVARAVNEGISLRGKTRKDFFAEFANVRGASAGRMGRVLRGEQVATFADLAFWIEHFPEVADRLAKYVAWWGDAVSSDRAARRGAQ